MVRESMEEALSFGPGLPLTPTILVVDDDENIGGIIAEYLQDEGFRVVTARDGAEGLRRAREIHPSIIISDVLMPNLDGYGLLERVRQLPELVDTPLILMSCVAPRLSPQRPNAFLRKPFDLGGLLSLVQRMAPVCEIAS